MQTVTITFAAGDVFELPSGNFFQYLRGQDPIEVDFWRGDGRLENESADKARPGYRAEPPRKVPRGRPDGEPIGFTRVVLKSATAQTIEVGVSEGEGGYQRFTGEVEVIGPLNADGSIDVGNRDDKLQRAPMTTLENANFSDAQSATVVVLSAAANVNGAVIRSATARAAGGTFALVRVGTNALIKSNEGMPFSVENIFIPAGVKLELYSSGASAEVLAWWEAL